MDRPLPNRYREMPIRELEQAMQRRAGELLTPRQTRTKDERAAFALDTGYLLLAGATPLMPASGGVPCTPEWAIKQGGGSFSEEFGAAYEREVCEVRYRYLWRARELCRVQRGSAPEICIDSGCASEESFRGVLAWLDAFIPLKGDSDG